MTSPSPAVTVVAALQRLLGAQHAAVYGFPLIGVRLSDSGQIQRARDSEAAHRLTRDALAAQVLASGESPAPSAASYSPPAAVTTPASAQRWALQLEEDSAAAYRYLLASTATVSQAAVRKQAVVGLVAAAEQATYWRALLTPVTPTEPFPGL